MPQLRRLALFPLLLWLALFAAGPALAQGPVGGPTNISAKLVAERAEVLPGTTTMLALAMTPGPGWHGYWLNGGDAGFGLTVDWTLPEGVTIAPFAYPVPEPLTLFGLMNHVYKHPYALLAQVRVDRAVAPGSDLTISGQARWLACTDEICVPESALIAVKLTAATKAVQAPADPRFDAWRAALPPELDRAGRWQRQGDRLRMAIPLPGAMAVADPHLFLGDRGFADYGAPQLFSRNGDWLIIETRAKGDASGPANALLRLDGPRGLLVRLDPGAVPAAGEPVGQGDTDFALFGWALGGALLGGLLLNLMPCVFPILSLKALSLARAGGDARNARAEALAYLTGATLTALALGGLLLALRAGGAEIGWAFQLQHPLSVFLLLLLALAITANLLGLYELPSFGGGQAAAGAGGVRGGFATGALAAFVATPCSGPFMGAALGATLALPAWAALPVFGGLGFGLALPFVAIAFIPALRRRLPRPGPWMARFRKWMALPMALTALALAWLLWQQVGSDNRASGISVAVSRTYSPDALAKARAAGKPVFVNFTADWCITCKVNEASTIARSDVQGALDRAGVVQLTGDWTNGDPVITRALAQQGRNSLPLYLWYAPGKAQPEVLPQILTPSMLIDRAQQP
jgi:DsbC/DsbD-like thiol-disulfide interchange protein/cytochrome c biogenesis protein CcdA